MPTTGSKGQPQYAGGDTTSIAAYLTALGNYGALVGNLIVGTSSQRTTFATAYGFQPWDGLTFLETDTRTEWRYNGTAAAWRRYSRADTGLGMVQLYPSASNGTIEDTGDVKITAGSTLTLDGVFDFDRFLRYHVVVSANTFSSNTAYLCFRARIGSADDTSARYARVFNSVNAGTAQVGDNSGTTFISLTHAPTAAGATQHVVFDAVRADTGARMFLLGKGLNSGTGAGMQLFDFGGDYYPTSWTGVNGFSIYPSAGTAKIRVAVFGH